METLPQSLDLFLPLDACLAEWAGALAFLVAGHACGQLPSVKTNFHIVIVAIIAIWVVPMAFEWMRGGHERFAA